MAINLGLVKGVSRGIAREAEWKFRDHTRAMAREESQLEKIIATTQYNKEQLYLRERNARADLESDRNYGLRVDAGNRAERGLKIDEDRHAYEVERRPWREKVEEQDFNYRRQLMDQGKERFGWEKDDRKYDIEVRRPREETLWSWQKDDRDHFVKVERPWQEQLREWEKEDRTYLTDVTRPNQEKLHEQQVDLNKGAIESNWLRNREMRRGSKTREQYRKENAANLALTWSQIKANNARAAGAGTSSALKLPSSSDYRMMGSSSSLPSVLTGEGGRKTDWISPGSYSQVDAIRDVGTNIGVRFVRELPLRQMTREQIEGALGNAWEGVLQGIRKDKDGKEYSVRSVIMGDLPFEQQTAREDRARTAFMRAARDTINSYFRGGTSPADGGSSDVDRKRDAMKVGQTTPGEGRVGPGPESWSAKRLADEPVDVSKLDLTPDGWWMRQFKKWGVPDATYYGQEGNMFMIGKWMEEQADIYARTGRFDWDTYKKLGGDAPDSKLKADFVTKYLPPNIQQDFIDQWRAMQQGLPDPTMR